MPAKRPKGKVFVIGLVGGIASGKSHLARLFQAQGAAVIDADELGHQVLARPLIARRLGQIFGQQILAKDGSVLRSELAKLVFGQDAQSVQRLDQLEEIVHPQIRSSAVGILGRIGESDLPPVAVVIDAPLLLEADWASLCDLILFVDSPLEVRQQRALRRGWSLSQFNSREQAQASLDEKRQAATHIVDGNMNDAELTAFVRRMLAELQD